MSLGQTVFDTGLAKRQEASIFCGNYHPLSGHTQPPPTFSHSSTPDALGVRGGALQMESKRRPLAQSLRVLQTGKMGRNVLPVLGVWKSPWKRVLWKTRPKDELIFPASLFYKLLGNKGHLFCLEVLSDLEEPAPAQKACLTNQYFEMKSDARVQKQGAAVGSSEVEMGLASRD